MTTSPTSQEPIQRQRIVPEEIRHESSLPRHYSSGDILSKPYSSDWDQTVTEILSSNDLQSNPVAEIEAFTKDIEERVSTNILIRKLVDIFRGFQGTQFFNGRDSIFSLIMDRQIFVFADSLANALEKAILSDETPKNVAYEALRWLGYTNHPPTYINRIKVLLKFLQKEDPRIRDSALVGLSYFEDKSIIPNLEAALTGESVDEIRAFIEDMIFDLKSL